MFFKASSCEEEIKIKILLNSFHVGLSVLEYLQDE